MPNIKKLPKYLRFTYEDALVGGVNHEIVDAVFETAIHHRSERDNWPHRVMTEEQLAAQGMLHKYREANNLNHWKMLLKQELWFPHPSTFNDPFDSQMLVRFDLMDKERTDAFIREEILRTEPGAGENLILGKMERTKAALLNPEQHDAAVRMWMEPKLSKTKVLCLGRKKDNILMWSHYAQNHEGFAIGFDAVKLNKLCFDNGGYQTGYVAYRDTYPLLLPPRTKKEQLDLITTLVNVKSRIWKYEREVRISLFDAPNKVVFSADLISELVMGCSMSDKCQQKLLKIADSQYPSARVYRAKKNRDSFSLKFEQVK